MKSHLTPLRRVTKEAKEQNAVEEEDKGASCMSARSVWRRKWRTEEVLLWELKKNHRAG